MLFDYPTSLKLPSGQSVKLNTDFRNWIKILIVGDDIQLTQTQCLAIQFRLAFSDFDDKEFAQDTIKNTFDYYSLMKDFLCCGKTSDVSKTTKGKTFDWEQDWDYILSAFKQQYKIDLDTERLHWYKFMALFNSLDVETQFMKIVGYRAMNLSEIKDKKMRESYAKLKKQYKLKDKWESVSDEPDIWLPQEVIDARQKEKGVLDEL